VALEPENRQANQESAEHGEDGAERQSDAERSSNCAMAIAVP